MLHHKNVRDVCYTNINNKELLVYACEDGVFAQNIRSSQQEWSITKTREGSLVKQNIWLKMLGALVRENFCSISTDGRGHIFISDPKNCVVSLFSCDGVELGTVMDLRDIGRPGPICWCESLLSLVVSYEVNDKWAIVVADLRNIV